MDQRSFGSAGVSPSFANRFILHASDRMFEKFADLCTCAGFDCLP